MILRKNLVIGPDSIITEILEDVIGTSFPNLKIANKSFTIVSIYFEVMFNNPSSVIAIKDYILKFDSSGYYNEKILITGQHESNKGKIELRHITDKQKTVLKQWFNLNDIYRQALENSKPHIRQALI